MSVNAPDPNVPMTALVSRLVSGLPDMQSALDREWLDSMREIVAIASAVPGSEALVRSLVPQRMSLTEATLEARSLLSHSVETGFALSLRPLNTSFSRRYGSGSYSLCTSAISVRQVPALPDLIFTAGG